MYAQQWSCDTCTYKQSASATRCGMCGTANPFAIGSSQSGAYYQSQIVPPKPKPVVKNELKYQAKPRADKQFGKIVYQTDRITKQQALDTFAIYLLNKDLTTSCWPLYVFGENDIDKARPKGGERDMIGGLAGVLGDYDTSISFGVTTTFYRNKKVNKDFDAFKKIIDQDFKVLLKYIKHGHNIIVPSPNMQDLYGHYEKSYWKEVNKERKQVIFHNIGTGLACIPFHYIEFIQKKFDILKKIGDTNNEANTDPQPKEDASVDEQKQSDKPEANDIVDKNEKENLEKVQKEDTKTTDNANADNNKKKEEDRIIRDVVHEDDEALAKAVSASLNQ